MFNTNVKKFRNITELNLAFSANIDDYGFEQFSLHCYNTNVNITFISTYNKFGDLLYNEKSNKFKVFNIEKCPLLTDEGLSPIYEYGKN